MIPIHHINSYPWVKPPPPLELNPPFFSPFWNKGGFNSKVSVFFSPKAKFLVDYALEISIFLMKIEFAKCKTAKISRLRRATNAKTTINMIKHHIYYLNVVFPARRRRKFFWGCFYLWVKPPPPVIPVFGTRGGLTQGYELILLLWSHPPDTVLSSVLKL